MPWRSMKCEKKQRRDGEGELGECERVETAGLVMVEYF